VSDPSPNELTIDRQAPVERIQLDDTSWVDLVEGFIREADAQLRWFLDAVTWSQQEVLRYDHYVAERRLGAGLRAEVVPVLRQADLHLKSVYHQPFDGVAGLLYRNGDDFQGLHSDREMRWLDDTLVAIAVLGVRRPFVFRPRAAWTTAVAQKVPSGKGADDLILMPGEGTLLVMGGRCQADWLHGVPAADTDLPRVSLTWRWARRAGRPDTNPGYMDGRQYSDRPRRSGYRRPG